MKQSKPQDLPIWENASEFLLGPFILYCECQKSPGISSPFCQGKCTHLFCSRCSGESCLLSSLASGEGKAWTPASADKNKQCRSAPEKAFLPNIYFRRQDSLWVGWAGERNGSSAAAATLKMAGITGRSIVCSQTLGSIAQNCLLTSDSHPYQGIPWMELATFYIRSTEFNSPILEGRKLVGKVARETSPLVAEKQDVYIMGILCLLHGMRNQMLESVLTSVKACGKTGLMQIVFFFLSLST